MLRPQDNRVYPSIQFTLSRKILLFSLLLLGAPALYFIIGSTSGDPVYSDAFTSTKYSLDQMRNFAFKNSIATDYKPSYYTRWNYSFSRIVEDSENKFDVLGSDVIVFIHIQKTAGTSFEKFLVRHLNIARPCECNKGKKRCSCKRPGKPNETWLFSRYSTGWVCGLHADFTELHVSGCVDTALDKKEGVHRKRRYFYTSFLRDPISRFISEFRHVNRGATWIASRHVCNGRPPTPDELPLCFDPQIGWDDVTLDEFLHCPFNLAFNRQTRMLADLTLVNCYARNGMNSDTRDRILLESAKNNLRNLAYFGIKERMSDSQWMFEELFGMTFNRNLSDWTKSKSNDTQLTEEQMQKIRERNNLDLELYEFAVKLFDKRLRLMKDDSKLRQREEYVFRPFTFALDANETSPDVAFVRLPETVEGPPQKHQKENGSSPGDSYEYDEMTANEVEESRDTAGESSEKVEFERV